METWHLYDAATGVFLGRTFSGPATALEANMPPGCAAMLAAEVTDWRAQRVDGDALVAYTPPPPDPAEAALWSAARARMRRNDALTACDWTQIPDAPLSAEARAAWSAYRQALRDVPQQTGFPDGVDWPAPPAAEEPQ